MKLNDQVCSLELAQKLKKLGVEQDSMFAWCDIGGWNIHSFFSPSAEGNRQATIEATGGISAFTAPELGEMLPAYMRILGQGCFDFCCRKVLGSNEWEVAYQKWEFPRFQKSKFLTSFIAPSEADARATLLVFLITEKLLSKTKGENGSN